jgi:hypothetical protein
MADPITLAVTGAVAGAMLNKGDPLKGALIGGTLGYGGGLLSAGSVAKAALPGVAGATPAGTSLYASAVPGLTSAGPGSQAAYLAGQSGVMGPAGLAATASSATSAGAGGPMAAGFWNAANKAMLPSAMGQSQIGQLNMARGLMSGGQQPQQQAMPQMMPMQQRQGQAQQQSPVMSLLATPRRREPFSLL